MNLSDKGRNRIFWMLQLGGWGLINLITVLVLKDTGMEFLLFSVISGILTGVLSTTPLRYYLRRRLTFDNFGWRQLSMILGAVLGGTLLYGLANFGAGYLYATGWDGEENEMVKNILKIYNSFWLLVINSLIIVSIWVVCYVAIKLVLKLNSDRLERLELNASLKQAQLNTLRGQINPHFMFNSLNNIRGLMLEDVGRSREMLTKLSEMLRYSLTQDDINATTLEEELDMVEHYIDLSRIQLEDRLRFSKDIDPRSLSVPIPPMIVQLLVENAVKHGIANRKEGGNISVRTRFEDDSLQIEVRNDGSLKLAGNTTQLGLNNIRQRLKLLYGTRAFFQLSQSGPEVVAEIKLPVS